MVTQPATNLPPPQTAAALPPLRGGWLWLARSGWLAFLAFVVSIYIVNLPFLWFETYGMWIVTSARPAVEPVMGFASYVTLIAALKHVTVWVNLGVALLIFGRRSDDRGALLISAALLWAAIAGGVAGGLDEADVRYPRWMINLSPALPGYAGLLDVFAIFTPLFLFPNGRVVPRGLGWIFAGTLLGPPLAWFFWGGDGLWGAFLLGGIVGLPSALWGQIVRYRHYASASERQQTQWVLLALGLWAVFSFSELIAIFMDRSPWHFALSTPLGFLISLLLPLALGISILRYRLWQIDLVINRTLVYLALTGLIALLYSIGVGLAGWLSLAEGNLTVPLVAVLAALALALPLQGWLQTIANRIVPSAAPPAQGTTTAPDALPAAVPLPTRQGIRLFQLFFAFYTLMAIIWLLSGLLPGLIRLSPTLAGLVYQWRTAAGVPWLNTVAANLLTAAIFSEPRSLLLFQYLFSLINLPLGIALVIRRPGDWVARLLALGMVGTAAIFNLQAHSLYDADLYGFFSPIHEGLHLIAGGAYTLALLLFPHGRLPVLPPITPRFRLGVVGIGLLLLLPVAAMYLGGIPFELAVIMVVVLLVSVMSLQLPQLRHPGPLRTAGRVVSALLLGYGGAGLTYDGEPAAFVLFFGLVAPLIGLSAQWLHYTQAANEGERRLSRTIMLALGLGLACTGLIAVVALVVSAPLFPGASVARARLEQITFFAFPLLYTMIPVALWMIVLRFRLWELDLLINRSLVYGVLTALVGTIYIVTVGVLGVTLQGQSSWPLTVIVTGLIAILFQPLRQRLQRAVNHLLYGQRDEPVQVVSQLGERLAAVAAVENAPATLVETVAGALKLPYVALLTPQGDQLIPLASHGNASSGVEVFPVIYQNETLAWLHSAPRSAGETLTPADRALLARLAQQAGPALHAVRLTADLQQSRERLVTAREEERRRLRRDLHDGLGPQLATLSLQIEAARNLLARDPAQAEQLLQATKAQMQSAITDVRRVVYNLRPPALDQLGLVSALREYATTVSSNGLRVTLDAPENLPPLPAAVEVATYRIAREAITNVVRHAQATECVVAIQLDQALQLTVTDNGRGLPADYRAGVGMLAMRERAEELGGVCTLKRKTEGGMRVYVVLPLGLAAS